MRPSPQQTQDSINVDLTLAQRRGRWNNVKPTLIWRIVSAGKATAFWFQSKMMPSLPLISKTECELTHIISSPGWHLLVSGLIHVDGALPPSSTCTMLSYRDELTSTSSITVTSRQVRQCMSSSPENKITNNKYTIGLKFDTIILFSKNLCLILKDTMTQPDCVLQN